MDVKQLQLGDIFIEDNYTDKYEVIKLIPNGVIAKDLSTGEEIEFSYTNSAYAPLIYLINR